MAQILVVDDEIGIRELLSEILTDEGHDVRLAENAGAARAAREKARPDLVLLDIWMPDTDGITLLKEWAAAGQLNMPVVMMSGHATIDTAVEATRIGALDFLEKPIGMQKLLAAVKKALDHGGKPVAPGLSLAAFPRSGRLRDLKKRLEQVAGKSRILMLRSPAGGIVELAARSLQVPGKAWLDLAESSQPLSLDAMQAASGGVLYCEELGRLNRLQQKNLVFAIDRLEKYGLRLVAATHHSNAELGAAGWDEAGLGRLFEVWLGLPALAELKEEIPDLAAHLLDLLADAGEAPLRHLSTAAQNALRQHPWPGGYAELKAAVRSLALAALGDEIEGEDVERLLSPAGEGEDVPGGFDPAMLELPLREAREAFERIYFEWHLRHDGGNMTRMAERTGLERTHLYRKLKDLGLRAGKGEA
ncbi:MAG TPA: response regulator [Rhodocyclaceae bacterium]|nr:response regulator [Rhodocyclaceae bacterium]HNH34415.1 response regulator [Rhodocyclaceae bacterium]